MDVRTVQMRIFMMRAGKAGLLCLVLAALTLAGFRAAAVLRETGEAADLAPANGAFADTSFGKVHVSYWGNAAGTPVIMTHGMAAWGGLWKLTAEALAGRGYRVIALDQAPFGFSDSGNPDFSRSAEANRLLEAVKSLGIEKPLLVGHSYGGGVALEAALLAPEMFQGMVLVCPVAGLFGQEPGAVPVKTQLLLPLRPQFMRELMISATAANPLLTKFLMAKFMHRKDAITPDQIKTLQLPLQRRGATRAMALWFKQFIEGDPSARSARREEAAKLALATELIWGEEDTVTPIIQGEDLAPLLKARQFRRIPGIGHMPQIEDPSVFNSALAEALDRLGTTQFADWSLR
jgi:pimeloyl-ACP methyl ester carboxylesterase